MHYWAKGRDDLFKVYKLLKHEGRIPHKTHFKDALPKLRSAEVLVYESENQVKMVFMAVMPYKGHIILDMTKRSDLAKLPADAFRDFLRFSSQFPFIITTAANPTIARQLERLGFTQEDEWYVATPETIRIP
jgi:hypothetical protein